MSAADANVKQVRLVPGKGGSGEEEVEGHEGGGGTRKQGRKRANHKTFKVGIITKEGGGSTSPGTMTQLSTSHVPGTTTAEAAAEAVGVNSVMTQKGSPISGGASTGGGAAPHIKVVLAAAKKPKGKVILAAAATPKPVAAAVAAAAAASHRGKTRKVARKIKVSMSSLSKKIHRAKTIRTKATKDTIEEVKKVLQKAGLIKAESKAPDAILRQMYADFMTLKNRAL